MKWYYGYKMHLKMREGDNPQSIRDASYFWKLLQHITEFLMMLVLLIFLLYCGKQD